MNQLRSLRLLLYQLKQAFGVRADLYYESADSVDLATGQRTVTRQKWCIRRAVCLPTVSSAQQLLPPAIVAIWRQGGGAQVGDRQIIIDRKDLPRGFRLETYNYSVIIDRRRYEVLKVEEFECELAYFVTLKELVGARVYEQVDVTVNDSASAEDTTSDGL